MGKSSERETATWVFYVCSQKRGVSHKDDGGKRQFLLQRRGDVGQSRS